MRIGSCYSNSDQEEKKEDEKEDMLKMALERLEVFGLS
jgi:hypothetical protein